MVINIRYGKTKQVAVSPAHSVEGAVAVARTGLKIPATEITFFVDGKPVDGSTLIGSGGLNLRPSATIDVAVAS